MCVNDLLETRDVANQTIHSLGVNIELGIGGGGLGGRLVDVFTHIARSYANLSKQKKVFT